MLALFAFLFALTGGAFASPFHGPTAFTGGGARGFTGPVRFDGMSGSPDTPQPPPPPGGTPIAGGNLKTGAPVRFDGMSGSPDHP
jgi:hypothetical protein